jgi:hypothetical protein
MQWLQNPNRSNANILNNVRREDSKHFEKKPKRNKKAHLEANIVELRN